MNTTALIAHWNMDGASSDLERRFRSSVDILAMVSEPATEESVEESSADASQSRADHSPLFVKQAGEDTWESLAEVA